MLRAQTAAAKRKTTIRPATGADDIANAKALCLAYAESLGFSLCFQGFDQEIAEFPGKYAPPTGALLIAEREGEPLGVVALRDLGEGVGEMKRLYVKPEARGLDLGRRLAEAICAEAKRLGYRAVRLDTLPSMGAAIELYRSMGFRNIAPYTHNPVAGAMFLEKSL